MDSSRRAMVLVLILMGIALGVTVTSGFLHVRTVRAVLLRGQADGILDTLRHADRDTPWDPSATRTMLDSLGDDGVRCLAVFDRSGKLLGAAGDCPSPESELTAAFRSTSPGEVVDLDGRMRVVRRRPDRPPREVPPAAQEAVQTLAALGFHPPPSFLVEFDPRPTAGLEASALRTLAVGGASALALFLTAALFWRHTLHTEALRQQRERERRLAALGEMVAVLSHELRNPLTSMKGHAQLLAEELPAGSSEQRKVDRVVHEAVRLETLAEDLLAFVRANRIDREEIDPAHLLCETAASVEADLAAEDGAGSEPHPPTAGADGLFVLDLREAPESWPLDPAMVRQMLTNLLRNAYQATPPGQPAEASIHGDDGRLVFEIRDFGGGLPAGSEERIFEPFHTTRLRGTGLGLAVARRVAELHGGTISAANHPQGGAVFRVEIPRTPARDVG